MHYHTHDKVNATRYTHKDHNDLEGYLRGTGRDMMDIRECSDPSCGDENPGDADYGAYD